jgi:hypothetical protein
MAMKNCCANCGGKFGLVCHHYWGMRFCCKACKKDFTRIKKWFWEQPFQMAFCRVQELAGSRLVARGPSPPSSPR